MARLEGKAYDDKIVPNNHEKITLGKSVYDNKELTDTIDRDFSSLIRSQQPITIESLFTIYRKLF